MSPAPNRFHQRIVVNLVHLIQSFLDDHPIGEVYVSPFDVYLTENDAYQPDVLYVSNANKGILTDQGAEGAPDLAIEVLSRKTSFLDLGSKRDVYARTGVIELWIADPETLTVALYRLQEDRDTPAATYDLQAEFSSSLLPGLIVRVADVFKRS